MAVARGGDAHAVCLGPTSRISLYARHFAVGILPPSSSCAALASFSSRDRTTSSFEAAEGVSGTIGASTNVGELLRVVGDSGEDYNAMNLEQADLEVAGTSERAGLSGGYSGGPSAGDVVVRILCNRSKTGQVIGKAGAVIKQLREETLSRIKVKLLPCPSNYLRSQILKHEHEP